MPGLTRQTQAGTPLPAIKAGLTSEQSFLPLGGFSPSGNEFFGDVGSISSGQNVWTRYGVLEPRWRLSAQSFQNLSSASNIIVAFPLSTVTNPRSTGSRVLGIIGFANPTDGGAAAGMGAGNVVWLVGTSNGVAISSYNTTTSNLSWFALNPIANASFGSTVAPAPSMQSSGNWRGAAVYSAPLDMNLMVLTGGIASRTSGTRLMVTSGGFYQTGPANYIPLSYLSGVTPQAIDIINFGNRLVAWGADGIPQRAKWHIEGDPTDWTGIGAGSQDLTDMAGYATRAFSLTDSMVLASNEEIWRGRYVGYPYFFSFSPITRLYGMPYERATVQTPRGIFWLGKNFTIYQMDGENIQELTKLNPFLQNWLRENLRAPELAFFTYNQLLNQLRLHFSVSDTAYPTHSVAYDVDDQVWTHEAYSHYMQYGVSMPILTTGTANEAVPNWDGNENQVNVFDAIVTSHGTFATLTQSATSDLGSQVAEDALFHVMHSPAQRTFLSDARYDIGARSASSLTASWSTDFGQTLGHSQALSITSSSYASQVVTYPKLNAQNFSLRLQSTSGSWQLRRVHTATDLGGEAR